MKNLIRLTLFTLAFMFTVPLMSQDVETPPPIEDVANDIIKVITDDTTAVITLPDPFIPTDPTSVFEWWMFIFALVTPIGLLIMNKFWPSSSKKGMIIKATSVGIIILMIIVYSKGATALIIGQAALALIMKVFTYEKIYKPLGFSSKKARGYIKE